MFQIELEKYMLKIRFLYLSIFLLLGCSSNQLESKVLEDNSRRSTSVAKPSKTGISMPEILLSNDRFWLADG